MPSCIRVAKMWFTFNISHGRRIMASFETDFIFCFLFPVLIRCPYRSALPPLRVSKCVLNLVFLHCDPAVRTSEMNDCDVPRRDMISVAVMARLDASVCNHP